MRMASAKKLAEAMVDLHLLLCIPLSHSASTIMFKNLQALANPARFVFSNHFPTLQAHGSLAQSGAQYRLEKAERTSPGQLAFATISTCLGTQNQADPGSPIEGHISESAVEAV